jgi:antimicrobial peptide system SdpA family protein
MLLVADPRERDLMAVQRLIAGRFTDLVDYFCAGLRGRCSVSRWESLGSTQHRAGIRSSKIIIVSTRAEAPIFGIADYSVVGGLFRVSPQLYSEAELTPRMDRTPYSEPGNLFGLDRGPRKQPLEFDRLLRQIHSGQWRSCTSDDQCRNAATQPIAVRNHGRNPTYCGVVTVIGYSVVPWAYRRLVSGSTIDSRAIRLDIQCMQD